MRTIENYDDFVAAMKDKSSDDRVVRNEAKNALGNFHIKYPEKYDKFKARFEGIKDPEIIIPAMPKVIPLYESIPQPKKPRKTKADKEQYIKDHPELNLQKLRNEAREKLSKGSLVFGMRFSLQFDLPKWITVEEVLKSVDHLEIPDLITASGKLAPFDSLKRKCIKTAAADGRIDETKLRQIILSQCANIWRKSSYKPDYPFASVKWFVLKVASAEELAIANTTIGTDIRKIVDIIFDKRISRLSIPELKEIERIEKVEKIKTTDPSVLRKSTKKACNYIEKHNKANDEFPFPEGCDIEDLKAAIDKINDDDLWAIFDGKRVDAEALYYLCIGEIDNSEQNERN